MSFIDLLFKRPPKKVSCAFDSVSWIEINHYFDYYNSTQDWPWVIISDDTPLPEVAVWKLKGHAFLASPEGWYNIAMQPAFIQKPTRFIGIPDMAIVPPS